MRPDVIALTDVLAGGCLQAWQTTRSNNILLLNEAVDAGRRLLTQAHLHWVIASGRVPGVAITAIPSCVA